MDGNLHICSSGEGETDGNYLPVYNTCTCGSFTFLLFYVYSYSGPKMRASILASPYDMHMQLL